MSKSTPGPWRLSEFRGHEAECDWPGTITGANGQTVFAGPFSFRSLRGETADEAEANAKLIAAAPDMLQFIKACERNLDCHKSDSIRQLQFVTRNIHAMAQELIRKIEG